MTEKSELLNQLKIDRTRPEPSGLRWWHLVLTAVICIAITAYVVLNFFRIEETVIIREESPVTPASVVESTSSDSNDLITPTPEIEENSAVLNGSGFITARRMATVSAELTGLITEVNVEEGMQVEQGQVLARLDDALANVNLRLAEAQIAVLSARRDSVQANLAEAIRNQKRILDNAFSSEAEKSGALASVEKLTANLASAEADITVAQLDITRQRERLEDHTIRAPFAGVVTVKNAQPGEIVSPASAGGGFTRTGICTIVDMGSLEIEVDVNEAFIGRVNPGQRVRANLDAYPEWDIPASVIAIIPAADRAKATVKVRISIDTKDARVLPDMGVKVAFLKV
ncbi:MAG: efflux RND transporter periplasmic adaptor subunit [Pseudomonadota bacterium]